MNSSCFISHHLFVSAAGHENQARVRSARQPREARPGSSRRRARSVSEAGNEPEAEAARQMELLAELTAAG